MADRLFVPLSTEPFIDFKHNGKQYEVRSCERGFSEKFVYSGRRVEIRKGYSGESLWGVVGKVYTGSLEEIFSKVDYRLVEPMSGSLEDAVYENITILGKKQKYIAFEVIF